MCGISGILHFDTKRRVQKNILKKMTDIIRHRGPDGEGFYLKNNIGLGHRRLSIIDLETGDQPMRNDDGSIILVFNGEIYNYIELREELKKHGHHFKTGSDTEVIIRAYEQWGFECQNKFNGMWAFALWDARRRELFLSRDRIGIKPLYYGVFKDSFYFGSELKSILVGQKQQEINYSTLGLYLTFGYIPAPYTFYENINKLEPGHYLIYKDGKSTIIKYWDPPYVPEDDMRTDRELVYEEFEDLLRDSVRLRLRSDVPTGAFLSGGLDSSSIVALLSDLHQRGMDTFTISYPFKEYDESLLAKQVTDRFGMRSNIRQIESTCFEDALNLVVKHYDEPFGDSSAIPTYFVSRFAAEKVKVVLTGDGGDEVLSGYTDYQGEKFAGLYGRIPSPFKDLIEFTTEKSSAYVRGKLRYKMNRARNVLNSSSTDFISRRVHKAAWLQGSVLKSLLRDLPDQISAYDFIDKKLAAHPYKDNFYKLMAYHLKISLPDDMLTKVDRMTMANSLEARVPFLDHRLIELMSGVHKSVKMNKFERKSVLRNTVAKKLPDDLLKARKKGFRVPLREWFKEHEQLVRFENIIAKNNTGLDKNLLKMIFEKNKNGQEDYGNFIWMIFVLNKTIMGNTD